jgi:hypothetical protein
MRKVSIGEIAVDELAVFKNTFASFNISRCYVFKD